ncbi:MAG TPA: PQQ-binding-like beta-propeller repeat protein [Planctomycetota bacterium]|nr:PQQ-binding-like beta-propeller repeat protein [Planctomycetota bacterium]
MNRQRLRSSALFAGVCLALALVPAAAAAEPAADEWPIAHNSGHTNSSPTTKLKPPLKVKWMTRVPGKFWTGAVVAERRVVAHDENGYLFCLDAETGELLWRHFTFGECGSYGYPPAIYGGRVYITAPEYGKNPNGMRCFDLETGKLIWQKPSGILSKIPGADGRCFPSLSPQVADGKLFYIANANAKGGAYPGPNQCQVQCWNAATGEPLWNYTMSESPTPRCSLVVVGDTVYASAAGRQTVALALDGKPRWSTKEHSLAASGAVAIGQIAHRSGELWFKGGGDGNVGDFLTVLNAADGTFKRKAMLPFYSIQWAFMGERYYGRASVKTPEAFDLSTGRKANVTYKVPNASFGSGCSETVAANGYIYAGFGNTADAAKRGNLWCAWEAATGEPVWIFPNATNCCPSPAIAYDRLYWVCSSDGLIYCFESAPGGKTP